MRKWILNLIEIAILLVVGGTCILAILQSTVLKNRAIYGYRTYVIASNSMYPVFEYGDVILVNEVDFNDIKVDDIITYQGLIGEFEGKIITHEVFEIANDKNGRRILKTKGRANPGIDPSVYEDQVYGRFVYKFFLISFISKIVRDELGFVFFIFIPFGILFVLELINMVKETRRRELERKVREQLDELKKIDNKSKKSLQLEETIYIQLEEIEDAKRDFKKMDELIKNANVLKLQEEIEKLKKVKKVKKEEEPFLEKTMVLFKSDDLMKEIQNELDIKKKQENTGKKDIKLENKSKKKINKKKEKKNSKKK